MLTRAALHTFRATTCRTVISSGISTSDHEFNFKPKFSIDEQEKILHTVNESDADQLSRFDVSQGRIKRMENWKNKKGPFRTLAEILEVEGLGIKILERLCESIISNRQEPTVVAKTSSTVNKNLRQFLTPVLDDQEICNVSSAVGFHVGPNGISWAKICRDENELQNWDYYDFNSCPKKMLPTDTFYLATSLLDKIPPADVYIFESQSSNVGQKQHSSVPPHIQQLELTSMLLTLLNTSPRHNILEHDNTIDCRNKVHYLHSKLSARLFRTLIGNERVASTATITTLLDNSLVNFSLPCTPITMKRKLRDDYYSQPSTHRELLGQALMLAITFMDVCVYKNPASHIAIAPGRR